MQGPGETPVNVVPLIMQIDAGPAVKVSGSSELAIALTVPVATPTYTDGAAPNVIVWGRAVTVTVAPARPCALLPAAVHSSVKLLAPSVVRLPLETDPVPVPLASRLLEGPRTVQAEAG